MRRPSFTERHSMLLLFRCFARLLGRECTHPKHLRTPSIPFFAEMCACGVAVRLPPETH